MNFALISMMLVIFALTSTTASTTTKTKEASTAGPDNNNTEVFEVQMVTSKSVIIFTTTTTPAPKTKKAPIPRNTYAFIRSNTTIEKYVENMKATADFWALSVSVSLLPQLRDELDLNSSARRYRNLAPWNSTFLNKTETEAWDMFVFFMNQYPAICGAFKAESTIRKLPSCVQALYVEPMEKLRKESTASCRDHLFTPGCNVTVALLGTGISAAQVSLWQSRMDRFSVYMIGVRESQRLIRREEALCYQFIFCLKSNSENLVAGVDAKLKTCIDAVNAEQGIIHRKR